VPPLAAASVRCEAIAVDGKSLRGTLGHEVAGVHLVAAFSHRLGITLSQAAVDPKTNEAKAVLPLLKSLVLPGKVVTGDAMFCQREIGQEIVSQAGDYLLVVRESGDVAARHRGPLARFPPVPVRSATTIDKRGGRVEKRRLMASEARNDSSDWPHLGQVFRIDRWITSQGETTHEMAVGVTSLDAEEAPPEQLLQYVRGHWGIENRLHWVRDVTMGEDASQVRTDNAPEVMAA
jgi:predicted transposase YbfD/YdcC